jgi:hypothetical protein
LRHIHFGTVYTWLIYWFDILILACPCLRILWAPWAQADGRTGGTDGGLGQTDGWRRTDGRIGWTDGSGRRTDRSDRRTDGQTDRQTGGQTDGSDGQTDRTDELVCLPWCLVWGIHLQKVYFACRGKQCGTYDPEVGVTPEPFAMSGHPV